MAGASAPSIRRARAVESFKSASECIGTIEPGSAVFAVTRGQFSMIDAILACLDQAGPARVSLWTWTIAEYEVECMDRLCVDKRVTSAALMIDNGTRNRETHTAGVIRRWKQVFGESSVKRILNHAKIATIESAKFRILLRGSMNLNFNPQFEQFDLTEGGPDFDLIRGIEDELPVLADDAASKEVYAASKVSAAFDPAQLRMFAGIKGWTK